MVLATAPSYARARPTVSAMSVAQMQRVLHAWRRTYASDASRDAAATAILDVDGALRACAMASRASAFGAVAIVDADDDDGRRTCSPPSSAAVRAAALLERVTTPDSHDRVVVWHLCTRDASSGSLLMRALVRAQSDHHVVLSHLAPRWRVAAAYYGPPAPPPADDNAADESGR